LRYVLITPARNEESFLGATIRSVIAQRHRPCRWVIVSDGSTDRTDDIVRAAILDHAWIHLIRMPEHRDRDFAAKVACFRAAYETVRDLDFDLIGNLDADITFDPDYFAFLISRFEENPRLGVAGTPFREGTMQYDYRFTSAQHVSGAVQLFRRECYVAIGGYVPIRGGGVDLVAVTMARIHGWQTRSFTEKHCVHHRKMGTADTTALGSQFRMGQKDYRLGWHPLWELFRSAYQMCRRPYIIGGLILFAGYIYGALKHSDRPVSPEFVAFVRAEQINRLRYFFKLASPTDTPVSHRISETADT